MIQLVVTIDDNSLVPDVRKAIKNLNGVTKITARAVSEPKSKSIKQPNASDFPEDIQRLIGIASDITVDGDDRLQYLLSK